MIIFIYGAESYRSRQKLNELKNKFVSEVDPSASSLIVLDGKTTTLKEISEKINTGSLFVKKRMIIIEDIFENKSDKVLGEVELFLKGRAESKNTDEDNIIIFKEGDLENKNTKLKKEAKKLLAYLLKQKYVLESKSLSGAQLISFIKQEVEKLNRSISSAAINTLIARTNSDLWRISSELHKLAMAISEQEEISDKLVKENVTGVFDENIFALTDAISARNKKLALKLLEEQYLAGLSEDYILVMLLRQFKILLKIKSAVLANLSATQIASELKIHPYVVKKSLSQVNIFDLEDLRDGLNNLLAMDFANKTGQGELKADLSLFLARL
jgi:DNA polymerase-3 subunit delta